MKTAERPNWGRLAVIVWIIFAVYLYFFPLYKIQPGLSAAKEARCEADIATIATQLEAFHQKCGVYPSQDDGLLALVVEPKDLPPKARWKQFMESVPLDPWGREYQYRFPGKKSIHPSDLYSLDAPGASGAPVGNCER
jgi:general secretion pathway protein G